MYKSVAHTGNSEGMSFDIDNRSFVSLSFKISPKLFFSSCAKKIALLFSNSLLLRIHVTLVRINLETNPSGVLPRIVSP